jgi:hypothetical protein
MDLSHLNGEGIVRRGRERVKAKDRPAGKRFPAGLFVYSASPLSTVILKALLEVLQFQEVELGLES